MALNTKCEVEMFNLLTCMFTGCTHILIKRQLKGLTHGDFKVFGSMLS